LAISLLEKDRVEVIAGINLPMLIKFASIRDSMGLPEAVLAAKEAARKYISVASEVLANS
jgi:PTS system mannose-specific IIA component